MKQGSRIFRHIKVLNILPQFSEFYVTVERNFKRGRILVTDYNSIEASAGILKAAGATYNNEIFYTNEMLKFRVNSLSRSS
ncbi:MAG TPA: hypothetical protein VGN63_04290 [Flavisolibacter sp.]|nr:hypothetical protein [Flavisolibacter sp.]